TSMMFSGSSLAIWFSGKRNNTILLCRENPLKILPAVLYNMIIDVKILERQAVWACLFYGIERRERFASSPQAARITSTPCHFPADGAILTAEN
ncbi:MAG: hypothetical protein II965_09465, partial [Pyramidobacter sp.]|nr:hypothetical protein [Pyramidobacter sp.]